MMKCTEELEKVLYAWREQSYQFAFTRIYSFAIPYDREVPVEVRLT